MNETIANQIFQPEFEKQKNNNHMADHLKSSYTFQAGIVPLGKLRIRQQRRQQVDCNDYMNIILDKRSA